MNARALRQSRLTVLTSTSSVAAISSSPSPARNLHSTTRVRMRSIASRCPEAESIFRDVLALEREVLGPDYPLGGTGRIALEGSLTTSARRGNRAGCPDGFLVY